MKELNISSQSKEPLNLWNKTAGQYTYNWTTTLDFHTLIYLPIVDRLIGGVQQKDILDAGVEMNGIQKNPLKKEQRLSIGIDGSHLISPTQDESFDRIIANMVLMEQPEIDICIYKFSR